jgi:hypothetical protein
MTSPGPVPETPESHGWLRRPELDQHNGVAWETPGGDVHFHPRGAFDHSLPQDNRHFATEERQRRVSNHARTLRLKTSIVAATSGAA